MTNKKHPSFLYALLFFLVFLLITIVMPPRNGSHTFAGSLKIKHKRLQGIPSPKLIFVGGSNLAYGLDSNLVENTFHMPVVNMGLAASYGLRYWLEEIKADINVWDTVIIVPEYRTLQDGVDGTDDMVPFLEAYPPSIFFVMKLFCTCPEYSSNFMHVLARAPALKWKALFSIIKKMWRNGRFDKDSLYPSSRASDYFDKHGDFFGHFLPDEKKMHYQYSTFICNACPEAIDTLNEFAKFIRKKRALVVIIPPPLSKSYFDKGGQKGITWPGKNINIPVLATPEHYVFPESDFFESPHHLNAIGRDQRTRYLIEDLKRYYREIKRGYY